MQDLTLDPRAGTRLRRVPESATAYFRSGNSLRSRSVGDTVLYGRLDTPALPGRLIADCEREIQSHLDLQPGDVEALSLARARTRWPGFRQWVHAASGWTGAQRLAGLLDGCDASLMACRGARYHHDGVQYGGAAFCNLFLSEDKGLDLHFAVSGQRIPLRRGTVVVFDTGQPHAVIARNRGYFDASDFPPASDCSLLFLTWEVPVEEARVSRALGVVFDTDRSTAAQLQEEQLRWQGQVAQVSPDTGAWRSEPCAGRT